MRLGFLLCLLWAPAPSSAAYDMSSWLWHDDIPDGYPVVPEVVAGDTAGAKGALRYYSVQAPAGKKQPFPLKFKVVSFEDGLASLEQSRPVVTRRAEVLKAGGKLGASVRVGSELIGVAGTLTAGLALPAIDKLLAACRKTGGSKKKKAGSGCTLYFKDARVPLELSLAALRAAVAATPGDAHGRVLLGLALAERARHTWCPHSLSEAHGQWRAAMALQPSGGGGGGGKAPGQADDGKAYTPTANAQTAKADKADKAGKAGKAGRADNLAATLAGGKPLALHLHRAGLALLAALTSRYRGGAAGAASALLPPFVNSRHAARLLQAASR